FAEAQADRELPHFGTLDQVRKNLIQRQVEGYEFQRAAGIHPHLSAGRDSAGPGNIQSLFALNRRKRAAGNIDLLNMVQRDGKLVGIPERLQVVVFGKCIDQDGNGLSSTRKSET